MRAQLAAMSAIVLLLCVSSAARADVKITVIYTDIEHEVSPNNAIWKAERKREIILTNDHKIKSTFDFGYAGKLSTGTPTLGQRYENSHNFAGMKFINSRWSIEKGAIMFFYSTESYVYTMRISTNGIDTCSATMQYNLKNGHKLFEEKRMSNHQDMK